MTERIAATASARALDALLQGLSCCREVLAILPREMCPLEEAGRPRAAIGMDEALAGLDDQPVTTGARASGKGVERAKELGWQMHGGRRHDEASLPFDE
jgi:hypothetical protein